MLPGFLRLNYALSALTATRSAARPRWLCCRRSCSRRASGFIRFALAIVVAAIVALFVVAKFPSPRTIATTGDHADEAPAIGSRLAEQKSRPTEQPKPATPQLILSQTGPRAAGEAFPLGVALTSAVEGASVVLDGLAPGRHRRRDGRLGPILGKSRFRTCARMAACRVREWRSAASWCRTSLEGRPARQPGARRCLPRAGPADYVGCAGVASA